ncbi:uncharacterized protein N0V89_000689 [Didymosphaeria variabile]|uniref:Uncharacterized protein n=1 Tax=Didymosphaeria variabile TaxID=1932322 RepID=A0A9W8XUS8_9PLEO|nr:uncharacterized protein N0V89_000689 [Didymosphaeria variabile]KAJ4360129.1 hypothetical protein N0V89_000689 [Didymosphaeria variabile]
MAPTLFLEAVHSLAKRGDDDIAGIPKWALVFLIMIGGGVLVVIVYGLARFMFPEKENMKPVGAEQADYMREVRARNLNNLLAQSVPRSHGPSRLRQSNTRYDLGGTKTNRQAGQATDALNSYAEGSTR